MKDQSLEARIQRCAEDYGSPSLRVWADEVADLAEERDMWRRSSMDWNFAALVMALVAGFLAIWVGVLKGWI